MAESNRVLAFDLDDTLYKERDFVRSGWRAVANHIAELNQGNINADELYAIMLNADNAFDALAAYLSENKFSTISIAEMVEIYRYHKPAISLDDTTRATLDRLKADGYILALITDGRSVTQRNKIVALGLDKYVADNAIIISDETGFDKNYPQPFELLRSRLGKDAQYTYIGDNPAKDFHYPNVMGWQTIMLRDINLVNIHNRNTTNLAPEYAAKTVIDRIDEIFDCLRQ